MKISQFESNSMIERHYRKAHKSGLCPFCPPHGGENASRKPRYSKQKPKYKQHRRSR